MSSGIHRVERLLSSAMRNSPAEDNRIGRQFGNRDMVRENGSVVETNVASIHLIPGSLVCVFPSNLHENYEIEDYEILRRISTSLGTTRSPNRLPIAAVLKPLTQPLFLSYKPRAINARPD
jgi:hypothetical protein